MVSRVEEAHELAGFIPLCIFCWAVCLSVNQVESARKVLGEQKRALFTRLAIRQQSP